MIKFILLMAVMAVATAAPGFVGTGTFAHGPHLFPGHVGHVAPYAAATPAIVKGHAFGAVPVASIAYASPAIVKSAVAPVAIASPAIIKSPIVGSYGLGHLGGFGDHLGGFGGHFIH